VKTDQKPVIVFVCEHGAAKSILAAAYFNKVADDQSLNVRAVARGTNPDPALSSRVVTGLREDGLIPTESVPRKISLADVESAERVITFCELPVEYQGQARIEHWEDIPPVSDNYEKARQAIIERIGQWLDR
jgi:arsenate reductase (thioredoxin)